MEAAEGKGGRREYWIECRVECRVECRFDGGD
jgi:hypothetical protein